jgi:hypothetical protein
LGSIDYPDAVRKIASGVATVVSRGEGYDMTTKFTLESIALREDASYFSPEKLTLLKRIFDMVCEEAKFPSDAKEKRDELAIRMLVASKITEDESSLIAFARKVISESR